MPTRRNAESLESSNVTAWTTPGPAVEALGVRRMAGSGSADTFRKNPVDEAGDVLVEAELTDVAKPLVPKEGLPVLHLFFRWNRTAWEKLSAEERRAGKARLEATVTEARERLNMQILTFSMIAHADLGFMIVGHDLHLLNALEKRLAGALGPEILTPVYQYFSLTEKSEYTRTEEEYLHELSQKEGIRKGHPELEKKLAAFRERMKQMTTDRLHPKLPDWEFFCFYPMNKRRDPGANWYALDFAKRKELMTGHGKVGREYAGRISQLVTSSMGLDAWEWGVTLFSHDPFDIKSIVYEMRFDAVSQQFGEFGEFYTGLNLPLAGIYERLGA